jgi:hypothetical protein
MTAESDVSGSTVPTGKWDNGIDGFYFWPQKTSPTTPIFNPGDVAAINAMIDNNGLEWTKYADETFTSPPPADWRGVIWSSAATNKRITQLFVDNQSLSGALNLSSLASLQELRCANNSLSSIDVSGCAGLMSLNCSQNSLSALNVNDCANLKVLRCASNSLSSLDVSSCKNLTELFCHNNSLSALNVSANTNLMTLSCYNNSITSLNLSSCSNLSELLCSGNSLASLNISGCTNLTYLHCSDNSLSSLNVNGCTNLTYLVCNDNRLSSLNVSTNVNLEFLICCDNSLTSVVLNGSAPYRYINVYNNNMTSESNVTGSTVPTGKWDNGIDEFFFWPQKSSPTSLIISLGSFANGRVTANKTAANAGEIIKLNVAPAIGYLLDELVVLSIRPSAKTIVPRGSGSEHIFIMPDYDVKVFATFKKTEKQREWDNAHPVITLDEYVVTRDESVNQGRLASHLADRINIRLRGAGVLFTVTAADIYFTSGDFGPAPEAAIYLKSGNPVSASTTANETFTFYVMPPDVTASLHFTGTILSDPVGNEQLKLTNEQLKAYAIDGTLYVNGLTVGVEWRVYNIMGALIHHNVANANKTTLPLPVRGIYVVTDGKNVVKLINY